ncbi:hypothetical protein BGZ98_006895 [Dissophora globulifera]|nr:hypothetical protein BGZ98_006895 [Dissophora globulifera]
MTMMPAPAQADLLCTQFGADTFHIGSTLKFQWNDTQSIAIDTFNLNLYCVQNNKLIQTITTLNQTSPSPTVWVVNSTLSAFAADCPYNQYQGSFDWTYPNPDTGATVIGQAKCKVLLLIGSGTDSSSDGSDPTDTFPAEDPPSSDIVISSKTKSIVIGVGCAVGVLALAGIVGFYIIRCSNRRAAEEQASRKLREPIHSGPLFAPMDRPSRNGSGLNDGRAARYNELASVTSASVSMGSPAMSTTRTEMVELGNTSNTPLAAHYAASPVLGSRSSTPIAAHYASPTLGSRSPTPIAAAHAKLSGSSSGHLSSASSMMGQERPGSLLTSSFTPTDGSIRSPSPHKNPFEQRENVQQYEQDLHLQQQQQQHQLQQLQQQQQQNYGAYPY